MSCAQAVAWNVRAPLAAAPGAGFGPEADRRFAAGDPDGTRRQGERPGGDSAAGVGGLPGEEFVLDHGHVA